MTRMICRKCPQLWNRGVTLLEILAVLSIFVLMGGLSAGVYQIARKNYALSATASGIEGLIVRARHSALVSGAPVKVLIDPERRVARCYSVENLGEWSFEEFDDAKTVTYGLSQETAALVEAEPVEGHVGGGIRLPGTGYIHCGTNPRFDVAAGLQVEAWIFSESSAESFHDSESRRTRRRGTRPRRGRESKRESRRAVVDKLGAFYLGVGENRTVEGMVGGYRVETAPGLVKDGRWTHIAMAFDGGELRLTVDGIERQAAPVDEKVLSTLPSVVPVTLTPLTIGSPRGSFEGLIDEVRFRGLVEPHEFDIPFNQLVIGWKKVIYFDRKGHLDARYHDRPVRVAVYEIRPRERQTTEVRFDFGLTFDEWTREADPDLKGFNEATMEARIEDRYRGRRHVEVIIDRLGTVR